MVNPDFDVSSRSEGSFSTVDKQKNDNFTLRSVVCKILNDYVPAKQQAFGGHPLVAYFHNDIPNTFYETGLVPETTHLVVGSAGKGNWATVPWICIFDRSVTTTATKGVYIVYLLSKDGERLYLTFNQGCTDIVSNHSKRETISIMRNTADMLVEKIDNRGFRTDLNIDLGTDLPALADYYQKGCIFYKVYMKDSVPGEEELRADLSRIMEIYTDYAKYLVDETSEHQSGVFDSWEIINENTAIKTCDKSFFEHNGSGIPRDIRWFFDAELLEPRQSKQIQLSFEGTIYQGRVTNDSTDRRRTRVFWNTDLGNRFKALRTEKTQKLRFERNGSEYKVAFDSDEEEMIINIKETLEAIKAYIATSGFRYDGNLIENFYLSLKSKPFVILAGISGTGKTRLVRLFAEAIDAEYKLVPVRPDWSDSSDLFGHVDLNGKFVPGAILDFIKAAQNNPTKPYFLCLDEMNLARVEYYLSDFLSVIETRDMKNGKIISDPLIDVDKYGSDDVAREKYGRIYYPTNLYVVGTVNMDETTFSFSKKVLDRANTIEFSYVNLIPDFVFTEDRPNRIPLPNLFLCTEYILLKDCSTQKEYITGVCAELQKINHILQKANAHVGYRVRDEIVFYMLCNNRTDSQILPEEEAMDNVIMQKILPRIQGSSVSVHDMLCELFMICGGDYNQKNGDTDSEKMQKVLDDKAIACHYHRSAEKLQMMVRRFEEDGFTSYWL